MSETWTEYAVRVLGSPTFYAPFHTRHDAETYARGLALSGLRSQLVGRQVTASDWLPVDQGGAS